MIQNGGFMVKRLEGKVAVVTGASKGIGAEIARKLGEEGASVVVNYSSSKKEADGVVAQIIKNGGKAIAIQADLSKPAEVPKLFTETKKAYGTVDILVNNAGIYEFIPLEEITPEHFYKIFNINVLGLLLATKEAVKIFNSSGGSIINIGSVASTAGLPTSSVYSSTKAAVNTITQVLGKELAPKRIRVNAVNPGMVITEGTEEKGITHKESDFRKHMESTTPLGRIGLPKDIAPAVAFLASDESSWITGETLYISGGQR